MLTYDDNATIRHAIMKRLDKEPHVEIADLVIRRGTDCIHVSLLAMLTHNLSEDGLVSVASKFDLPPQFELIHLHNEIDEIAESIKQAKREAGLKVLYQPGAGQNWKKLSGTGLRGRWAQHAN